MSNYITVALAAINHLNKPALHADDRSIPGLYHVELDDDLPKEKWASAALDIYHSLVPVKNLDDFAFVVFEPDTGIVLPQDPDHEDYSYSDRGGDVDLMDGRLRLREYEVTVQVVANDGSLASLSKVLIVSTSMAKAKELALKALWDARLDAAGCRPRVTVEIQV